MIGTEDGVPVNESGKMVATLTRGEESKIGWSVTTAVQISSEPAMAVLIQQDIAPPAACFKKAGWGCHGGGV